MKNTGRHIPWPTSPDQINPAMLDDIARQVSDATPDDKKVSKQEILEIIQGIIGHHYKKPEHI